MGFALTGGQSWYMGYRYVAIIQIVLTGILIFSLPLWRKNDKEAETVQSTKPLTLKEIFHIPGAKEVMLCFFCYCALEQTSGLWAASYLTLFKGMNAEQAAGFASMFYLGITIGRAISGFITMKFNDRQMIRLGIGFVVVGIVLLFLPLPTIVTLIGFIVIGLGCAPIYPCIIHSTPSHFGRDKSQAIIGVQMASAYIGTLVMPPLFGWLASIIGVGVLPIYLLGITFVMAIMHERLEKKTESSK